MVKRRVDFDKPISVHVDGALDSRLRREAKKVGISLSSFTRMCIVQGIGALEKSGIISADTTPPQKEKGIDRKVKA
jgi:hypothetical protein